MEIDGKHIETIFDHNPTDLELKRFGGKGCFEYWLNKGINIYDDPDNCNFHLGLLFSMRGDDKKANEYWSKIEHKEMLDVLVQDF